jgi:hypothetical protein
MASEHNAPSTFGWIPQLFYDLIGRVIPGVAILMALPLMFEESAELEDLTALAFPDPSIPSLIVSVLVAYLIGALLGALSGFFLFKEWRKAPDTVTDAGLLNISHGTIKKSFMYDAIQLHDPVAGARLAKLAAEQHMCRVLIIGFAALGILHITVLFFGPATNHGWLPLSICVATVVSAIVFYRHLLFRASMLANNVWYALDLAVKTRASSA